MRDNQFSNLHHRIGAMEIRSRGEALAAGYCPAFTAVQDGRLRLIVENLPRPDMRVVIGCYQRADKFCRDSGATPSLVIVTASKGRLSAADAARQLREFAEFWAGMHAPGGVREVLVLSDRIYADAIRRRVTLLSEDFRALCVTIALGQRAAITAAGGIDPEMMRPREESRALTA